MSSYSSDSNDEEYEVELVVDHRGNGRHREYLVKWMNYGNSSNTWEPATNLSSVPELVQQYLDSLDPSPSQAKTKKPTRRSTRAQSDEEVEVHDVISIGSDDGEDDDDDDDAPLFASGSSKRLLRSDQQDLDADEDWGQAAKGKRLRTSNKKSTSNTTTIDENNDSDSGSYNSSDDNGESEGEGDEKAKTKTKTKGWERCNLEVTIDGDLRYLDTIIDSNYPAPRVNWEKQVKEVIAIFRDGDQDDKRAILEWKNGDNSIHDISKLHKKCPLILLKYYERFITYKDDIKVSYLPNEDLMLSPNSAEEMQNMANIYDTVYDCWPSRR